MDKDASRAACLADGYTDIETKSIDPNVFIDTHSHPFDVRALVLAGNLTLNCSGELSEFKAGDLLELGRDIPHTEQYGPQGYTILLGRRHSQPSQN